MGEGDRARISSRQMPPWHIDKTVGIQKFKNDRSLSDAQIEQDEDMLKEPVHQRP